jgi:hypothetical protein
MAGTCHVWTTSGEIDELDRQRSLTLNQVLAAKQAARGDRVREIGEGNGSKPSLLFLQLQREIFPKGVKGKK